MPPHQAVEFATSVAGLLHAHKPHLDAIPTLCEKLHRPQAFQERALYVSYMNQSHAHLWPIVPSARNEILLPEWQQLRNQLITLEAKMCANLPRRRLQLVKPFDATTAYSLFKSCSITPRTVNPAYYFMDEEKDIVEQGLFNNAQALFQLRHTVMRVAISNMTPLAHLALTRKMAWEISSQVLLAFGDFILDVQSTVSLLGY